MNQSDEKNGADPELRKILGDLPRVGATPDFEQRLQRRLAEERQRDKPLPARGVRIPAFAYSTIAVVMVGVVSYYILVQTKFEQTPVREQQVLAPRSADTTRVVPSAEAAPPAPVRSEPAPEKKTPVKRDVAAPTRPLESSQSAERQAAAPLEKTGEAGENVAAPAAKAAEEVPAARKSEAPAPLPAGAVQSVAAPQVKELQMESRGLLKARVDSAAIRDSLRADSLRKVRERMVKPPGK